MFNAFQPTMGDSFKAQSGIVRPGPAADLPFDFQFTVLGLERARKLLELLAVPFYKGIVFCG